jgi:hypothetical protein
MADENLLTAPFTQATRPGAGVEDPVEESQAIATYSDEELLDLWSEIRKESLANRYMFERQWQRNIWYVLGRQWIEYLSRYGGWRDKRIAQWIPRPVTNKCKETVQAIRAMFASIQLGVNVRPNGGKPENVSAAATADALAPVLHERHHMNAIQNEFDFWLVATGNAFIHTFVDYDVRYGVITIDQEQCQSCGAVYGSDKLTGAQPECPDCHGREFAQAVDPETGELVEPITKMKGRPVTIALSPLELAFPNSYPRFDDLPYVVRLRWRTKRWVLAQPDLAAALDLDTIVWQKSPTDQSLQIFTNLSKYTDLGLAPTYSASSEGGSSSEEDGIVEYEVWMKPTAKYPDGLVFRVLGDGSAPQIVHLEETEQIPGPLPYKQFDGQPLFTFAHACFEHVGGRVLGSGPLDVIIQKQDQLNQLDSMILLIIQRMSNPVWLEPKGAEIQRLTGMPGLVIKYNPLTVGGNAKPERIAGVPVDSALFAIREQYLKDIEELAGTYDVIKGSKPSGVEATSALQLLVERSQARFASVFTARGDVYKNWFKFAIELEREFGPDELTKETLEPGRSWTFESFKRSQLDGSYTIIVEDGTAAPKTTLGIRAAIDHAAQLQMLNMQDPDVQYEGLKQFGLTRMIPSMDIQIQGALQKQNAFQDFIANPQSVALMTQVFQVYQQMLQTQQAQLQAGMDAMQQTGQVAEPPAPLPSPLVNTPFEWLEWYNPIIHRQEFLKWANSDRVRDMLKQPQSGPIVKAMMTMHLQEMDGKLAALQAQAAQAAMGSQVQGGAPPQNQQGAGRAMRNSNQNSGHPQRPEGQK